jgi:hypothetical protein
VKRRRHTAIQLLEALWDWADETNAEDKHGAPASRRRTAGVPPALEDEARETPTPVA